MNMIGKIINTLKVVSDQKRQKIQRLDFIQAGQSNGRRNYTKLRGKWNFVVGQNEKHF